MPETCPVCAEPASGRFCAHCGAALESSTPCASCGNPDLPADARFCNQCGASAGGAATVGSPASASAPTPAAAPPSNLPWIITGAALVMVIGLLLWPRLNPPDESAAPPFAVADPGDPRAVDLSSMTPRQAADRLFNRVMQSVSAGDSAQARAFLPMALGAYQRVDDLDNDGHYHLAVLHLVNADPQSARLEAEQILATEPDHLFGLFTAAEAEVGMGDAAAARELYQRFLDVYEAERARGLQEYEEHQAVLPSMFTQAERMAA